LELLGFIKAFYNMIYFLYKKLCVCFLEIIARLAQVLTHIDQHQTMLALLHFFTHQLIRFQRALD